MPSGDPQRQWFPEMIEMLRQEWHPDLSWAELTLLAGRLDSRLQGIRRERKIRPPMFRCPACGAHKRSAFGRISVNATILAAGRFGACAQAEAKRLSRRWITYRKSQHLDRYGREEATQIGVDDSDL